MNKTTIDIEGRFIDNISSTATKAKKSLDDLEKAGAKAKPKVDANTSKFDKKMKEADAKLDKLGALKATPFVDLKDKATEKIKKILNFGKTLAGKMWAPMVKLRDSGALQMLQKIQSGGKALAGKTWTAVVKIKDMALSPINKIKNALFSVKTLVGTIFAGMAANQLIMQPIGLADAYSSAKIGFSTLLGESRGTQMMNDLDEFAKATPFKSSDVIGQTQRMLAMGWDAEAIIDDMRTIGDAAAATGKGEMGLQQIVTALAQIKTKGKLSTEELNQLAEAGISAKRYIAEGLGYGSGDEGIAKMTGDLEDGAIQSGKALTALLEGMKEYQGMMDKTANETVSGLKSQLEDTFEINILRRWGQGLQEGAKEGFGSIVSLLDKADTALTRLGDTVQELGSTISNWAAGKLENAVKTITEITDSYAFGKAGLGEKMKMLWSGLVADPLKEWWENGGETKTAETAGKIGTWMGKMLSQGLLAIFGATDVLVDSKIGENGGMTIAQSFVKGFKDNFDSAQITNEFIKAIENVWDALPWWGKTLIVGNVATNALTGIGNTASAIGNGASTIIGALGSTGNAMVSGTGILSGLASTGYALTGGAAGSTLSGAAAAGVGAAGIAGGVIGGAAAIKGGIDLYGSAMAYKAGNKIEGDAKLASGGGALGGALGGAALGTAIAPGIGTAIGAGIGGLVGWLAGDYAADNIRKSRYESEAMQKAIADANVSAEELSRIFEEEVYKHLKSSFGELTLSLSEIQRISDQVVWGNNLETFEAFTTATKTAKSNLEAMNAAAQKTEKWLWKAGLGVTFNADEKEDFMLSFDEYVSAAQSAIENKHYEFTTAVKLLLDEDSLGNIITNGDAFYAGKKELASKLSQELSDKLKDALSDGVISTEKIELPDGTLQLSEQEEIANLQQQIADITTKIANAEMDASIDLMGLKYGSSSITFDSFENLIAQMQTTIDERMTASDDAFVASVSSLKIQLEEDAINQTQYDEAVAALMDGYSVTVGNLRTKVKNLELEIIADSQYGEVLGDDAVSRLNTALENALSLGVNPIDWTPDAARRFLGIADLSDEAAGALSKLLGDVATQLESFGATGKLDQLIGASVPGEVGKTVVVSTAPTFKSELTTEEMGTQIKQLIPDYIDKTVTVGIKTQPSSNPLMRFGGDSAPGHFRGGIVSGGSQLVRVAEEGAPEMIIPLSAQRRERGIDLWNQAGHMLGIPGFARGGLVGNAGLQVPSYSGGNDTAGAGQTVQVDVGGITVELNVQGTDSQSIATAVKAQAGEIAEAVAGIFADAFEAQFKNIPVRGGAR